MNKKKKIIIVDDDESTCLILEEIFKEQYDVAILNNGNDAIEAIKKHPIYDLIIIDLLMPSINGFEVLEKLNENPKCSEMIRVIISGLSDIASRVKAYALGAADFFVKPFYASDVLQRVNRLFKYKDEIDVHKLQNEKFKRLAFYDELTNILNRTGGQAFIEARIAKYKDAFTSLFLFDIDNFKKVNDIYGHATGDYLLSVFGNRLKAFLKEDDCAIRLGGDEFAIFFFSLKNEKEVEEKAKQILEEFNNNYLLNTDNTITISYGIAYSNIVKDFKHLYLRADRSLCHAKNLGKNCFEIYSHNITTCGSKVTKLIVCSESFNNSNWIEQTLNANCFKVNLMHKLDDLKKINIKKFQDSSILILDINSATNIVTLKKYIKEFDLTNKYKVVCLLEEGDMDSLKESVYINPFDIIFFPISQDYFIQRINHIQEKKRI